MARRKSDSKQAAVREAIHVALDAGIVTDVSVRVPDLAALDRWRERLIAAGWHAPEAKLVTCPEIRSQWWSSYCRPGNSTGGLERIDLTTESEPMPADAPAATEVG
jgi:hypothetical protein